jgi:hypothetical protein
LERATVKLSRDSIAGAVGLAGLAVMQIHDATAQAAVMLATCTNPSSGASWQISIDYQGNTVDANPASIGPATISWHNAADGGNYTLDRKSGNLTVVVASSTGGYFLFDHCQLEN